MSTYFNNIPLEFDSNLQNWMNDNLYQLTEYHNLHSPINSIVCRLHQHNESPVAVHIRNTLKLHGLTGTNFEVFTYKTFLEPNLDGGYPHIDFANNKPVSARLNFLLEGKNDKMYWWPHTVDSNVVLQKDIKTDGNNRRLRGYLVDDISNLPRKEMYNQLGKPVTVCENLYNINHAAIVRTDILHAVTWSGGPRLILSMQILESWEEISNIINDK
jgi:hypothetical protein